MPENKPILHASNRAFRYGDAIFESMHANGTEVQFFDRHFSRLAESARKLHFDFPMEFSNSFLKNEIRRLVQKNRIFKGSRIRLSIFRNDGGFYTPTTNQCSYLMEQAPLLPTKYELNSKGLVIDIYTEIKKPANQLAGIKSANALLFVLAGIYKKEHLLDDCLLLNESNKIIEATSSNVFLYKQNKIYTPPLKDGCLPGIMRSVVLSVLERENIEVLETSIEIMDLETAEEIFLSNAVNGIQWVSGYGTKRYFNQQAKFIIDKINQLAFS